MMTSLARTRNFTSAYRRARSPEERSMAVAEFSNSSGFNLISDITGTDITRLDASEISHVNTRWNELKTTGALDILLEILDTSVGSGSPLAHVTLCIGGIKSLDILLGSTLGEFWIDPRFSRDVQAVAPQMILNLDYILTNHVSKGDIIKQVISSGWSSVCGLFTLYGSDAQFVASCSKCALWDLTYFIIFDPFFGTETAVGLAFRLKLARVILQPDLTQLDTVVAPSYKLLRKLNPRHIEQRCLRFFDHSTPAVGSGYLGGSLLVAGLVSDGRIRETLTLSEDVYSAMLAAYWAWKPDDVEELSPSLLTSHMVFIIGRILDNISSPPRDYIVIELVRRGNLILMMARGLIGKEISSVIDTGSELKLFNFVKSASAIDPDLMEECAILEWFHAYKSLRTVEKCSVRRNIGLDDIWCTYAQQAWGLTVARARLLVHPKALTGCSWSKCVLHQETGDLGHEMLRCTTCRKVQYCSVVCQRRDWREGDHKKQCHNGTATFVSSILG